MSELNELDALLREAADESQAATLASDSDLMNDIHLLKTLRDEKADLELKLKICNKKLAEINVRVVAGMELANVTKLTVEGIGTVYGANSLYPQVKDAEAMMQWLKDNHFEALVRETVHPQTLKAWVKDRMEGGEDMPPETVLSVFVQRDARIRKG